MTPSEKATGFINEANHMLTRRLLYSDNLPATHCIANCDWPAAIKQINEAINKLNLARAELQPLAESRPRD